MSCCNRPPLSVSLTQSGAHLSQMSASSPIIWSVAALKMIQRGTDTIGKRSIFGTPVFLITFFSCYRWGDSDIDIYVYIFTKILQDGCTKASSGRYICQNCLKLNLFNVILVSFVRTNSFVRLFLSKLQSFTMTRLVLRLALIHYYNVAETPVNHYGQISNFKILKVIIFDR